MEEWKDIVFIDGDVLYDYSGLYEISNHGRIRSLKRQKLLTPAIKKNGYCQVALTKNKKSKNFLVHRLVAFVFLGNENNLPQVNHKDENKQNNHVDNLEWCTEKYNSNYGTRGQRVAQSQLSGNNSVARKVVCVNTGQVFSTARDANKWCGVNTTSVCLCCQGKQKWAGKHPETKEKLVWQYIE